MSDDSVSQSTIPVDEEPLQPLTVSTETEIHSELGVSIESEPDPIPELPSEPSEHVETIPSVMDPSEEPTGEDIPELSAEYLAQLEEEYGELPDDIREALRSSQVLEDGSGIVLRTKDGRATIMYRQIGTRLDASAANQHWLFQDDPTLETATKGEDPRFIQWKRHTKHVFMLTGAGKPAHSRWATPSDLANFASVVTLLATFAEDFGPEPGDRIRSLTAGRHTIAFRAVPPLYMCAVSKRGETAAILERQLSQLRSFVTQLLSAGYERQLHFDPSMDLQPMLSDTSEAFSALIDDMTFVPHYNWHCYNTLHLHTRTEIRDQILTVLHEATCSDLAFSFVFYRKRLLGMCSLKGMQPSPFEVHLLSNLVYHHKSLRQAFKTLVPISLPFFMPGGFIHCFTDFFGEDRECAIVLVTDTITRAWELQDVAERIQAVVEPALDEIKAYFYCRHVYLLQSVNSVCKQPVLHFAVINTTLNQCVFPQFGSSFPTSQAQIAVLTAYQRLYEQCFSNPPTTEPFSKDLYNQYDLISRGDGDIIHGKDFETAIANRKPSVRTGLIRTGHFATFMMLDGEYICFVTCGPLKTPAQLQTTAKRVLKFVDRFDDHLFIEAFPYWSSPNR